MIDEITGFDILPNKVDRSFSTPGDIGPPFKAQPTDGGIVQVAQVEIPTGMDTFIDLIHR
jgi:hypothetical protein